MDVDALIELYELQPHPEGGHYRETYSATKGSGPRGAVSAIYYLLKHEEKSAWHRIDAVEIWIHCAGDPLRLSLSSDGVTVTEQRLGTGNGAVPHAVVPINWWQSAVSEGAWSLVSCVVAPAFDFSGFEMAPQDWHPGMQ